MTKKLEFDPTVVHITLLTKGRTAFQFSEMKVHVKASKKRREGRECCLTLNQTEDSTKEGFNQGGNQSNRGFNQTDDSIKEGFNQTEDSIKQRI